MTREIERYYLSGMTQKDIASTLGCSRANVCYHISKIDKKPSIKNQAIELYSQGLSITKIAEKLNKSVSVISQHLLGIKKRKRQTKVTKEQIEAEILKCNSYKEVCDNLGITHGTYYRYIRDKRFKNNVVTDNTYKNKTIELRSKGKSIKEVAKSLNISTSTVVAYSKGHKFRPVHGKTKGDNSKKINKFHLFVAKGRSKDYICDNLNISGSHYYRLLTKYNLTPMKTVKPKEIIPAEISRDMLGKGFERGKVKEVKLRDDRDSGRLVKFKYSDLSDYPTVLAEIRVRDLEITDQEAIDKWGKKHNKKSWRLV